MDNRVAKSHSRTAKKTRTRTSEWRNLGTQKEKKKERREVGRKKEKESLGELGWGQELLESGGG